MDELDHLGWVVQHNVGIGRLMAGLRTNDPALGDWLADVLEPYLVEDVCDPYWSVLVAPMDGGGAGRKRTKAFNILYQESRQLVRELSLGAVIRGLHHELERLFLAERDDAVHVDAAVVEVDGVTMLVPGILVPYLATLGRGLGRAGIRLPLDNTVAIDLHTGQVAPVPPALGLEDAFEDLADEYSGGEVMNRFELRQPVDVDVVCSVGLGDELVGPVSRATATYRLASHAQNLERVGVAGVIALQRASARARTVEIQSRTVRQTADALRAAAAL